MEAGDWTGPAGAQQVLARSDIEVGVLETARGGIVLRGMGYESNDASILTNVSSDHLDLQGIHTLPELAEVKSTVCRITKPDGWVVLNGDDPLVAAVARRVRANVAFFSMERNGEGPPRVRRHVANGGRAYLLRDGWLIEASGTSVTKIAEAARIPIAIGGLARHNVANALAAAGGARGLGASIAQVRDGLLDFRPSTDRSPGRLNLFRLGSQLVIVDFAHNEAGISAVLDVAEGIAAGGAGRTASITAIIGTAGDRPDDTLRGIGRIAAHGPSAWRSRRRASTCAAGRRRSVVGELLDGVKAGGGVAADVPIYESETAALRAEINGSGAQKPRVIVLMCHEERDEVFALLSDLGARPVDVADELTRSCPGSRTARVETERHPIATPRIAATPSAERMMRAGRSEVLASPGWRNYPWRWSSASR